MPSKPEIKYEESPNRFYDTICPDFEAFTFKREKIILSDLIGNVIILRFTKFYAEDLPYLIYLEHLYNSFKDRGVRLLFICPIVREKIDIPSLPNSFIQASIEDDGHISAQFQARLDETVIVGRDFKIKLKTNQADNVNIYNVLKKILFSNTEFRNNPPANYLDPILKKITFLNVQNNRLETISEALMPYPAIILLSISNCFSCPENKKIEFIRRIKAIKEPTQLILLFGRNNNCEQIRQYAAQLDWFKSFTVGIVQNGPNDKNDEYYRLFELDVNPRLFFLDKNKKMIYAENFRDQKKINVEFIIGKIY